MLQYLPIDLLHPCKLHTLMTVEHSALALLKSGNVPLIQCRTWLYLPTTKTQSTKRKVVFLALSGRQPAVVWSKLQNTPLQFWNFRFPAPTTAGMPDSTQKFIIERYSSGRLFALTTTFRLSCRLLSTACKSFVFYSRSTHRACSLIPPVL